MKKGARENSADEDELDSDLEYETEAINQNSTVYGELPVQVHMFTQKGTAAAKQLSFVGNSIYFQKK